MCLIKLHTFPKISSKPITCYKLVGKDSVGNYYTKIMRHNFHMGDTIKSTWSIIFALFTDLLERTAVHAYFITNKHEMLATNRTNSSIKYIECEIPPFTFYYYGLGGEIGASKIKTIKEVTE